MKSVKSGAVMLGIYATLSACSTQNAQNLNPAEHTMKSAQISISAEDPRITVTGRSQTLDSGGVRFAYPGVTLKFNAEGRSGKLFASSSGAQSYLEVIVDNGEPRLVKLGKDIQSVQLFNSEQRNAHSVEVSHRSETWHGIVTVHKIEIIDGDVTSPPSEPNLRLLILGDSVTCGEAIERASGCEKNSSWWNPRLSYGMLTAAELDAQVHLVCYGGRGLVRSWNGKTDEQNLPDYFELAIADAQHPVPWDHDQYSPDLILSAIGTNDFSLGMPEREKYVSTYQKFVQRLLELHPNAQIVLTEGAILSGDKKERLQDYLNEVAQRINNPRLTVMPSAHYPGDDCDAHPTKEQHKLMAAELSLFLRKILKQ